MHTARYGEIPILNPTYLPIFSYYNTRWLHEDPIFHITTNFVSRIVKYLNEMKWHFSIKKLDIKC